MKTKTTLAALLLAAVMVTPSYGADEPILKGAEDYYNNKDTDAGWLFNGYVLGYVFRDQSFPCRVCTVPEGVTNTQIVKAVAKYIHHNPAKHHIANVLLIATAVHHTWPMENKRHTR